ncbi:MAG TPA: BTAD domain-containing putative transcriptional regulator, partial [Gaiellaceae bacterium]|nr:BTAD domain-containing putative transcriptional regulator [Gaiellaceae bacterium]
MEFRILGPLEVEAEGRMLKLGSTKQRALLAFLLLHANKAVARDRLIDELWSDDAPETAATAIQVYVSQLRKVLGREVIATQAPGYVVRVQDGELDLEHFEQLVARARTEDPEEAAATLRSALALWRGAPLAELDASFARPERAGLEEQRLAAIEQRIQADLELSRHVELVPELERLVHEHPLRERLRGQLMLALYRCGRQADALDVYRSGRRLLDQELGLEPGDELRRLERAILEQDPALEAPGIAPTTPHEAAVPTGTVTFLFTDIEGSTRLVQELGDEYGELLSRHHALLLEAFGEHGGQEIDRQGDALFFAFRRARDAVRASVETQLAVASTSWPRGVDVRVRIGIHTGEPPGLVEGGYHGLDVVRAARISGAAHGGQILVSSATRDLVGEALPDVSFLDLEEHRLKEIARPERIFQVVGRGLPEGFPLLRTEDAARVMTIGGREEELAVAAEAALETEEHRARWFRRSRVLVALGVVVLAIVAAALAVALTRGGSTPPSVTVLPNSVAVVDPAKHEVVADVSIGGRPVALAADKDAIWVADADDGTVSRIDPKTYEVVKTIGLGADVNDVAVGFGSVWVAGGNDEKLFRIDPRTNALQRTLQLGKADPLRPQPVFFVAAGRKAVWALQGATLLRIDPATDTVTKRVAMPAIPVDLGAGAGNVWVTTQDQRLVRVDESSASIAGSPTELPGQGASPIVTGGALWLIVYAGASAQLWKLDPSTLVQQLAVSFPPTSFPFAIGSGSGIVSAVDNREGNFHYGFVREVDPTTGRMRKVAKLPHHPISVAVTD